MPGGQNIISLGFDVPGITAEKQVVLDLFKDMFAQLEKYDGARFNPLGNGGLTDLKKSISDGAAAMQEYAKSAQQYNDIVTQQAQKQATAKGATTELSAAVQAYQRITDQLTQTQAKNNASHTDAAAGLAAEKAAYAERNKELAASARLQSTETASIGEAEAANAALSIEKRKLNLETEEGKTRLQEINAEMNKNTEFIKENGSAAEKQRINIGNYAGSLSSAFDGVKEQLATVNQQLSQMETRGKSAFQNISAAGPIGFDPGRHSGSSNVTALASGGGNQVSILNDDAVAYQKLTLEQKILEQSLQRQAIGFRTANQEMRNVKYTLDAMTLAGLENTQGFEKLNVAYTTNEQKVKDLHREQAILTTDAPALTALTGVARGLGGAYALGAGAAQLFATGNEKLDAQLNKLVAIMTFLQGLEQAVAALKTKNAIATALEQEATKALNAVKAIEISIFSKSKAAQEADAVARNINTEATVVNTEATEASAVAMTEAGGAAIGLKTALVGIGIGAIIIAVGVLVAEIIQWSEAENLAAENSAELAEAMEKVNEILIERIRLSDEDSVHTKKNLEDALSLAEKNKQSYNDIYNIKKAQADLDQKTANDDLRKAAHVGDLGEAYRVVDGQVKQMTGNLSPLLDKEARLNDIGNIWLAVQQKKISSSEAYFQIYQKYGTAATADQAKDQLESVQKEIAANQKLIADKKKYTDAYNQSVIDQEGLLLEKQQHDAEEERKISLATATTEADAVKAKNQLILNDDRSTLAQRVAAMKSNAIEEQAVIDAGLREQLSRPDAKDSSGNLTADSKIAIQKAAEEKKKVTASTEADIYKVIVEWNDKRLQFLNAINRNELEGDAAVQDGISKNEIKGLEDRLAGLQKSTRDRALVIQEDFDLQMKLAKEHNRTQEELDKIESDRKKATVELTANVQKQIYDIVISWGERRIKAIEELNKATDSDNAVTSKYAADEQKLNAHLGKNLLYFLAYAHDRKKLDEKYALDKTAADIKDDEAALKRLKDHLHDVLSLELAAANANLDVAKAGGNPDEIANAQAKVDALKKVQLDAQVEITGVQKKLLDDLKKNQDDQADTLLKKIQKTITTIKDFSNAAAQTMVGLFDATTDKQIQSLELITQRQDAAIDATIAGVQRGTESQREQQEEVTILTKQKEATDSAAKKKEAQDKRAEAVLDRDLAVASVVWNTEAAIAKTFGEYGFTPVGFALAAVGAALGVVEVATILSKPIPAYSEGIGIPGKGTHPGGAALVGEDGTERVTLPGYDPFIVNQPTLLSMPSGSIVEPLNALNRDMMAELGGISMRRAYEMVMNAPQDNSAAQWEIARWQTSEMKRALRKSQRQTVKVITNINITEDASTHYKIYGKKR